MPLALFYSGHTAGVRIAFVRISAGAEVSRVLNLHDTLKEGGRGEQRMARI